MVSWPGHIESGAVDERFALNIDIAPTVLEAAGIPLGETPMDGRSLLAESARNRVHLEYWCHRRSCDRWASTRTHDYQYIERYDAEGNVLFREYYDNEGDPWQLTNLLKDGDPNNNPDVAVLDAQLEPDRSCIGGLCP
jgi:arylsulfatase A-like enzyme